MGEIIRIDLKGQNGLRSYCYEGHVGQTFRRGLAMKTRLGRSPDELESAVRSSSVIDFPRRTSGRLGDAA
jgi:hypothetical protein